MRNKALDSRDVLLTPVTEQNGVDILLFFLVERETHKKLKHSEHIIDVNEFRDRNNTR
jgi:hypothetical protein